MIYFCLTTFTGKILLLCDIFAEYCERLGCSQKCEKINSTYRCVCDEEFRLDNDNVTCVEKGNFRDKLINRNMAKTFPAMKSRLSTKWVCHGFVALYISGLLFN